MLVLERLWGLFPPTPVSAVSPVAAQHSCPACLSVPRAGTGCERVHGVVALAQVAEREGGRGVTGAWLVLWLPVLCK